LYDNGRYALPRCALTVFSLSVYLVIVQATVQEKKRQRKLTPNKGQLAGRPLDVYPHRNTSIAPSGTACTHAATSRLGQATSVGQVRRGPVGEKKSEGGYASPLPSPGAIEPPPPLSPVSQSKNPIPYDVCCKLLWPTRSAATACKGGSNVTCRKRRFGARRGRFWRADGTLTGELGGACVGARSLLVTWGR
jgi:hypothetical protein